ncbi:OadG family protein [Bacillota bacterium Meth-B3]|nr:OadG family protein [Christensenellaceae bacterium]
MYEGMTILSKGFIVAGLGLCGTFLVLILIFLFVKLMQKMPAPKGGEDD